MVMLNPIRAWIAGHPRATLVLLVLVTLGPFLAKPFNIDDPLFVWLARQVRAHPGDPFGYSVNWYGMASPMWDATENPPLAGYYFALVADVLGWNEFGFHCAGLVAALAAVLGTYRLAWRLCNHPLLAAVAVLFTPVFVVSANTVMCDVPLLALWVWAVVFWVEGLEQNSFRKIIFSGVLVAMAALTKYFGVALIPLLAVYGGADQRRVGKWIAGLLIPLVALGAYCLAMRSLYGHDLLSGAFHYSAGARSAYSFSEFTRGLITLAFIGGGVSSAFFLAPLLWRAHALAGMIAATAAFGLAVCLSGILLQKYTGIKDAGTRHWVAAQLVFWAVGGTLTLALAARELATNLREPRVWLLVLWVAGTFIFAAFCNWTVNGRTILPLAPAVGILLARQFEKAGPRLPCLLPVCLVASALLALSVAWSDFALASAVRRSAREAFDRIQQPGRTIWFQGHWGFQYYMQQLGARAVDYQTFVPSAGDIVVIPLHNVFTVSPRPDLIARWNTLTVRNPSGMTTWNKAVGAGFYSSLAAPLPFAIDKPQPENVMIYELKAPGPR